MSKLSRLVVSLLAFSLVPLASGCTGGEHHEVVVASTRRPCMGVGSQMCLSVQEEGAGPSLFYDGIEGFSHRWGVETRLRYTTFSVDDPPEDGSSERYVLDEIVSEATDPVGTRFDLKFPEAPPGTGWFEASGDGLSMVGTKVSCDAPVCADIVARTAGGAAFEVTFELTSDATAKLRALSVE